MIYCLTPSPELIIFAFCSAPYASLCQTHRRAQPLQSEAANAKKASETTIPGVLRMRPAPIDSMFGTGLVFQCLVHPSRQQKPGIPLLPNSLRLIHGLTRFQGTFQPMIK